MMISIAAQSELRAAALSKGRRQVIEYIEALLKDYEDKREPMRFVDDKK